MLSGREIRDRQFRAARQAAEENRVPFIIEKEDVGRREALAAIPFIGPYRSKGYRRTKNLYFVDSSGFGEPGEPALTVAEFEAKVRAGYAYAITKVGQFQVYIQEFSVHTHPRK